jgi:hypothetical protein
MRDDPSLLQSAFDEVLRRECPVQTFLTTIARGRELNNTLHSIGSLPVEIWGTRCMT